MATMVDSWLASTKVLDRTFRPHLSHNPNLSTYDATKASFYFINNIDHLHVAVLSVANPLTLHLPSVQSFNAGANIFFVYCRGPSGGQITISPYTGQPDVSEVIINGGAPGASVSYTQAATQMVLMVIRSGYQFYVCPVSFALGGGGGGGSTVVQAGTGVSVTQLGSTYTVANTAPDQTVAIAAGSGINVGGVYPNFTVANSAPDQVVSLSNGAGMSISGSYPNFTLTNASPDQTVVLSSGAGISATGTYPNFTIANTAPDQVVALTAGVGMSVSGSYPSFSVTNTSPDQVVSLTSSSSLITVSGTYPNFVLNTSSALMAASYFKASQTIASVALPTSEYQITTAFTLDSSSSDWTVDASGGMLYSGSVSGRAFWVSVDVKYSSATAFANSTEIVIQRGSNIYPIFDETLQFSTTAFLDNVTSATPVVVEPGDILHLAIRANAATTVTSLVLVVNLASA